MTPRRVHIVGASGTGTTTLGHALAAVWSVPHADTDDYFWVPTTPAYTTKREPAERLRLMREVFVGRDAWVLSGSLMGWGDPLVDHFNAVVFLSADPETRLARLRAREAQRYGARIGEGGDLEAAHQEFMDWARRYEDPAFSGRSRARHERWLKSVPCPVLHLDGTLPVIDLVTQLGAMVR